MRVAVVGGGLAGATAALELAARGAVVTLVRAAPGATALGWGTLDVAAASPWSGGLPLRDALHGEPVTPLGRLRLLLRTRPWHPYRYVFPADVEDAAAGAVVKEAAASLDAWLRPAGLRVLGGLDTTRWLADVRGALRAADLAFTGPGEGELAEVREAAFVDLPGLAGWEPRAAASAFAAEVAAVGLGPLPVRLVPLELPAALLDLAPSPARLSAALETDAGIAQLRQAVSGAGSEGRLLLFPPVLGLLGVAGVLDALREVAGTRVAELVGAPPFAPAGLRLDAALRRALETAGVALRRGRVAGVEREGDRARALVLEPAEPGTAGQRLATDAVVLATGRFVGGGVVERAEGVAEALLGLPLHDADGARIDGLPARRAVRLAHDAPQPLFACGVRCDARLRPLGSDGRPALANVFAAGDLLGGFDPALDRTGLGVALLCGRHAAGEAARTLGLAEGSA